MRGVLKLKCPNMFTSIQNILVVILLYAGGVLK